MESSLQRPSSHYLPTLDGWRCIAISMVLLFHGTYTPGVKPHGLIENGIDKIGSLGVLIFFAISGFLITSLLLREEQKTGQISLQSFYIRRAFRILPPAILFLAVLSVLGFSSLIPVKMKGILAALFFFANYSFNGWYTGHFWSLSVEEHFYLFWPSIMAKFNRKQRILFALGLVAAVGILRAVVLHGNWHLSESEIQHFLEHTEARADYLMYGCLAAIALQYDKILNLFRSFISRGGWLLLLIIFGFLAILGTHIKVDTRSVQALLLALIVSGTVISPKTILGKVLELAPLRWIGRLSYSIYLWQQLFLHSNGESFHTRLMWLPLKLVIVLLVAFLSYYFVERPTMNMGRSIAARRNQSLAKAYIG